MYVVVRMLREQIALDEIENKHMEDTKKAQQPKKLLSELQEEMISALNKLVASMEEVSLR